MTNCTTPAGGGANNTGSQNDALLVGEEYLSAPGLAVIEQPPQDETPAAAGSHVYTRSRCAISIDIETLGTRVHSVITSIGAVRFDPQSDWIGAGFHVHIDIEDSMNHDMKVDADTLIWWLCQSDAARQTLCEGQAAAIPLSSALDAFTTFAQGASEIWCNGASFDFSILGYAYLRTRRPQPWNYWDERDLRTLKAINKGMLPAREGIHHSAIDDARHQARLIQHIFQSNPDVDA